jgi:HAD superfamily hydrolase (TIGR01509 family)
MHDLHNSGDLANVPHLRVEAVMFDLDGTLIDSTDVYYRIVEVVLERLGLPVVSRPTILDAARDGDFDWNRVLPEDTGGSRDDLIQAGWELVQEIYPDMFRNGVDLVPGAASSMQALADAGMDIGIVTSTPRVHMRDKLGLLDKAGVLDLVRCVITADDTELKKPAPDPLLACGRQLGVSAEKNMYVGDTRVDILAGRAAGMKTIGVLTGFDGRPVLESVRPDAILASVAHLGDLLLPARRPGTRLKP